MSLAVWKVVPFPSGSALRLARIGALLLAGSCACSSSESDPVLTPFPLGQAMVYGGDGGGLHVAVTPSCDSDACSAVRERCGDSAYAEVMLDRRGAIADVVCYRGDLSIRELGLAPVVALDEQSESVIVFDSVDDGADVVGDVTLRADDVVLYGAGAQVSVLGGTLGIEGDRATVRGLSIAGDVIIDRDGAKLSLVEIQGELIINADDVTINESVIVGRVQVMGKGAVLVRNLLGKNRDVTGTDIKCNLNQRFDDIDQDGVADDGELGGEVSCG
jgi:hypothetical protein